MALRKPLVVISGQIQELPVGDSTNVTVVDAAADTTCWPMLATSQTGDQQPATDAGLSYNASTNVLTTGELSTNGTAGGLDVVNANSTEAYQIRIIGSMTLDSILNALSISPTMTGGASSAALRTIAISTIFTPTANSEIQNILSNPTLNNGASPTSFYGQSSTLVLGASALGGTVTTAYGQQVGFSANAAATTNINTFYSFRAGNIVNGAAQTISNAYSFSGAMASGTGRYNCHMSGTAPNYFAGDLQLGKTITAAGTTGARTINQTTGSVNFAAAATSLVVTNSLVSANSIIICTVGTNDITMKAAQAVAAAGSFTIYPDVAPTAETRVNFIVTN